MHKEGEMRVLGTTGGIRIKPYIEPIYGHIEASAYKASEGPLRGPPKKA
jgi:hypothetical protein